MKLLIVESPNKIKKLKSFLDDSWTVSASVGHICDLPDDEMGIDLEKGTFDQKYRVSQGKTKVVEGLKSLSAKASEVYLASDPDREGEAISWHLARLLKLDIKNTRRVCFYSITKEEVLRALKTPQTIDLNLVDAYKTRRAVDRIFGYELSPAIQRFGLKSAGRCQTPCLNIVVQREEEIKNFKPRTYYALKAYYKQGFFSEYAVTDDKGDFKISKIQSKDELERITTKLNLDHEHKVVNIKTYEENKNPRPPFITSSIIAEAAAKLNFKPKKTTELLQSLFHKGFITYIRTDSTEISEEGLALARTILSKEHPDLLTEKPVQYNAKKSAQGAHECIRPTHANDATDLKDEKDELALYALIRNRFLASQCKPQVFKKEDILLTTDTSVFFLARNRIEIYKGFAAIYAEEALEEKEEGEEEQANAFLNLHVNSECTVDRYETPEMQTKPPSRFKLSTLTKEIEKQGIGRPSTFSTIVQTPLDRGYYEEGKKGFLMPTQTGTDCIKLLSSTMPEAIVADYTRELEEELDNISEAKSDYKSFMKVWYADWSDLLNKSKKYFDSFSRENPALDNTIIKTHENACPVCQGEMVVKKGKFGKYAECLKCQKKISLAESVISKHKCPDCNEPFQELKGKFGKYYKCPKCGKNINEKAIKTQKSIEMSEKKGILCPLCQAPMIERKYKDNKTGKTKKFWGCSKYPTCKGAKYDA